jgi:DNA-3-methyladenine glycosylase II
MKKQLGAAIKYFEQVDPTMAQLLQISLAHKESLALPSPKPTNEYFGSIASSIISQQISTHAARAVKGRVLELLGTITPDTVLAVPFAELKACGLSEKKTTYIKHNAELWHEIPYGDFVHMDDEAVIHELTKLYGIGRWTAEMFLMFSLARPDVFSYGDLGLMQSLYHNYSYRPHYKKKIRETVERWSPYRTIASLTLWHTKDAKLTD